MASRTLGDQGLAAVRVEVLASAIGVTKGSFYSHFASRAELLHAVLDDWERRSTADVLERVEALGAKPASKIRLAGLLTFKDDLRRVDLAVRDWARTDPEVRERLRRVDKARMDYVRQQFGCLVHEPDEIEARSVLAFTLAIGRHFLVDNLDDTRADAVMRRVERLLGLGD
ncbi:TetR/AcrR family transcriptional regulator [Microbacterium sp.]|uniref:TetR/AcrR family transcriptional regulator n=1 Tax=Microbacterium sp. TaxID=51671 RepID=UPI002737138F|nr:TetR/AcrR family transcriptional regulator [Microbacterium sp.]MDP3951958.1 helix-turn-helix domain-containing protein [Microbacterium sp.]